MKSVMGPLYTQMQPVMGPPYTHYPSLLTWKSSWLFGAFQGAVEGGTSDGSGGNGTTVGTGSDGWYK